MHSVPPQPGLPLTPQHLARHLACPRHQNMLIDCSQSTSLSPPPPPPKCTRRKSLPVFPLPCMIFSHLLSSTSLSSHNPAAAFSPHPVHSVLSPVFSESIPPPPPPSHMSLPWSQASVPLTQTVATSLTFYFSLPACFPKSIFFVSLPDESVYRTYRNMPPS